MVGYTGVEIRRGPVDTSVNGHGRGNKEHTGGTVWVCACVLDTCTCK